MKYRSRLSFWLLLLLAILPACAASAEPSLTAETLPTQPDPTEPSIAETVEAATEAPSTPLVAGATAMPGGFTTAAYNGPLPVFDPLTGGGDDIQYPEPCWDYLTGGGVENLEIVEPPAIRVLNEHICILGMKNTEDTMFTVTLESPDGEIYEGEYLIERLSQDAIPVLQGVEEPHWYGWAMPDPAGPTTIIPLKFTAGLPEGSWLITVRDSSGDFDQWTTTLITHEERALDFTPDWPPTPFRWHRQFAWMRAGETVHIAGAHYPPGTGIVMALYSTDGTPLYATRFITDGEGTFQTTFDAPANMLPGNYLLRVAVEPDFITESWLRGIFIQE